MGANAFWRRHDVFEDTSNVSALPEFPIVTLTVCVERDSLRLGENDGSNGAAGVFLRRYLRTKFYRSQLQNVFYCGCHAVLGVG